MESIIDAVLALARAGQDVDDPVGLDAVATDAWAQVPTLGAAVDIDTGLTVQGDPTRLQRLFENAFRNCVEHVAPGEADTPLDLSVTVGALPDGEGFYVEDDGVGIPAEERDRVLEFGYSTADDGTGVGLSVVEDIAEAHGWAMTVTEADGGGARFEFEGVV
ncbi:HAMP domain-containing sensor histidine kinase [Haloplanus salilacus]|uniref:sensor histidine kinase n=1 Tax=Haloplanus salilacus TaxID=2949994 RepID=UPI0030CBE775